ncbi:MAG: ABC transporter ATP-binding protein [Pseudomonadales bacterium]|jgi:ABC-2 type transport system ATP-binding protein|nr:ABC transporter ATP-binding protein [Pseudomonadales bacterium]
MATHAPLVRMDAVHVERGGHAVLRGLDFTVQPGEVFALLGGNGAGKSTTLLTCLGLLAPSRGTVHVLGASPQAEPERVRRGLAYLPEQAQLYPHLDARENLDYFLRLAGLARDADETEAALDTVGLQGDARGRRLEGYSKGMRQKVAIALALLRRTPLLLLDEPTSGLDPLAVEEFDALVHALGERGVGVLMVTHDLFGACRVASRLGVLHEGRLAAGFEAPAEGRIELAAVREAFAAARDGRAAA